MDKKCMFVTHSKSENETDRCARACTSKVNLFGMQTHARSSSHRNVYGDCYLSIYVWCWQVNHSNTHILSMILIFFAFFFSSLLLPQRRILVLIVVNRRTRLSLACLSVDQMECVEQHQQYQQSASMIDNGKKCLSLTFAFLIGQCIIDRHFHFGHRVINRSKFIQMI